MSVMTCHFAKGKTCFNVQMETKWLPRPIGVDREWKKKKKKKKHNVQYVTLTLTIT